MYQAAKQIAVTLFGIVKLNAPNVKFKCSREKQILIRRFKTTETVQPWPEGNGDNGNRRSFDVKEICIPLPHGTIAGKSWGRENNYPVLALHGWLDNCGTFDRLIPLLSKDLHVVAIDAPGHGLSSHKPNGCYYRDIDFLMDFKRVVDHLGWEKFHIIGHSLGGQLALMFASVFPNSVHKLVVLDAVKPTSRSLDCFPNETINAITEHMKIEDKLVSSIPLYTIEKATARLMEGMFNEVSPEAIGYLVQRGTRLSESGEGFMFSRDLRCRLIEMFSRVSHETMKRFMEHVKCELLMIFANNTHKNYKCSTPEVIGEFLELYQTNCKQFTLKNVDGNHFAHLNNPEQVAPLINEFFSHEASLPEEL